MVTEKVSGRGKGWLVVLVLVALVAAGVTVLILPRLRGRDKLFYRKGELLMRSGDTAAALASFRKALAKNPRLLEAHVGVVRALAARREFVAAEQELAKAVQMGFPESEAGLMRADIYADRADYRLSSAQEALNLDLCASAISEDLDPAIALVQKYADSARRPAEAYTRLGDYFTRRARVQNTEWELLVKERERAKALSDSDEETKLGLQVSQVLSEVGQSQREAIAAYERAVKSDPALVAPRLAIADQALSAYVPAPERARKVLEPILEKTPDHRRARLMLATVENTEGHYDKALEDLAAILPKGQDDYELLSAKGRVLHDAGRWDELLPLSATLVQLRPNDISADYYRARALLNSVQPDPASRKNAVQEATNYLQLIFRRPTTKWPQARLVLAQALAELGNQEQARSAYRSVRDDITDTKATSRRQGREMLTAGYTACMALYQDYKGNDPKAATQFAREAFQALPEREEGYKAAKETQAAAGATPRALEDLALAHTAAILWDNELDRAIAVCTAELANAPSLGWGERLSLLRARLFVRKGAYAEAMKAYEDLLGKWTDRRAALELASLHIRFGRTAEAQAVYEKQLQTSPGDLQALVPLLGLLTREGRQEEARALVTRAQQQLGPETTQALLVRLSAQEGQMAQALSLARSLVALDPQKAPPYVALAELQSLQGDRAGARESYDKALALDPAFLPGYRRALLDLEEGDFAKAKDLMGKAQAQFPNWLSVSVQMAVAEQGGGDAAAGAKLLQDALAVQGTPQPSLDPLHWYLAVTYAGLGDAEKARTQNRAIRMSQFGPTDARQDLLDRISRMQEPARSQAATALNLLVTFSGNNRPQAAVQEANALQQMLPGEPLPPCLSAELLDQQGKHQEAVDAYRAVIRANPQFLYARLKLVDSLVGAGDDPGAVQLLEEALGMVTEDQAAAIQFQLGRIYGSEGQVDAAIQSYKAAMSNPKILPLAANNLAWLMATARDDPAGALPYARQAADAAGSVPGIADTVGWVYYLNGDVEEAIPLLEKARSGAQANPTVRYHLGMAYLKVGRNDEGRAELREALTISKDFPEAAEATAALGAP